MSRKCNFWDNAVAESFFKTLKSELVYGTKLRFKEEMSMCVFEYIEFWYNHKRRFSYLDFLNIDEFRDMNKVKNDLINNVA
jgi:transposase InsO family protein